MTDEDLMSMKLRNNSSAAAVFRRNGLALLLTGGLFALVYAVVFNYRLSMDSDFTLHTVWAIAMSPEEMISSFYDGSEHLWHLCVKLLFTYVTSNMWVAAAIVTAAADAAAYFLVYKALDTSLSNDFPRWLLALLTVSVFVANALTLPGFDFYVSRGAINTWHNPTNIMVRPFAAAVFFMTVRIYNRRRYDRHSALVSPAESGAVFSFHGSFLSQFRQPVYTKAELVLYPLCILLSAYAKPSFLQFFAPAILIFLLIDVIRTRGMLLPFCIKMALAYIPAALIILSQFSSFFGAAGIVSGSALAADAAESTAETVSQSGVAIYFIQHSFGSFPAFLRALWTAVLETLYLCAFPLFMLLVAPRTSIRNSGYRLGLIGMLVARLEALCLHELGSRASHGNFLWGFYLSAWMLWCASIGLYAQLAGSKTTAGKLARWGGTTLLLWHLVCGIFYVAKVLQTSGFYF